MTTQISEPFAPWGAVHYTSGGMPVSHLKHLHDHGLLGLQHIHSARFLARDGSIPWAVVIYLALNLADVASEGIHCADDMSLAHRSVLDAISNAATDPAPVDSASSADLRRLANHIVESRVLIYLCRNGFIGLAAWYVLDHKTIREIHDEGREWLKVWKP